MHPGNLAFFMEGERVIGLTPTYDMLPMYYAPQHGNLPPEPHRLPAPSPLHARVWATAEPAARDVWEAISVHEWVSAGLRQIAVASLDRLEQWRKVAAKLPS